jgi:hypothetical protein
VLPADADCVTATKPGPKHDLERQSCFGPQRVPALECCNLVFDPAVEADALELDRKLSLLEAARFERRRPI